MRSEKNEYYCLEKTAHESLVNRLKKLLSAETKVIFVYLHGSFMDETRFRDLDLAVFLDEITDRDYIDFELELEASLRQKIPYPVDVRVLNKATPAFCYRAIRGIKLKDSNEKKRVEFETSVYRSYHDFLPFRRRYLKEALNNEI